MFQDAPASENNKSLKLTECSMDVSLSEKRKKKLGSDISSARGTHSNILRKYESYFEARV